MDALLRQSPTVAFVADRLGDDLFTLIDVGCGGGLMPGWRALGKHLRAYGFDPQRYEIARLRTAETNPLVRYVEGYVGVAPDHPLAQMQKTEVYWSRSPWSRLAPAASQAIERGDAPPDPTAVLSIDETVPDLDIPLNGRPRPLSMMTPEVRRAPAQLDGALTIDEQQAAHQFDLRERNLWLDAELADPDRRIVLPEFLAEQGVTDIDFLKIDVDGPDYEILYTMSERLNDAQILGVSLEVNYNGSHHAHHHTFHNMDRFMRAHGFALFDLTVRTYSSSALPQPYVMSHAAQSIRGRPLQGDALYIRDFGQKVLGGEADQVSDYKLAKTAMLFAMFDKPAEAVEHLLRFRSRLAALFDVDHAIELLTSESQALEWTHWSYVQYMKAFQEGDPFFFNRLEAPEYDPQTRTGAHPTTLAQDFARREQVLHVEARAEAARFKAEAQTLATELEQVKASRSWRWTSPMRRLLGRGSS